jgi:hypothetical protein
MTVGGSLRILPNAVDALKAALVAVAHPMRCSQPPLARLAIDACHPAADGFAFP